MVFDVHAEYEGQNMIELSLQFSGPTLARMKRLQEQFPREMKRANGRAAYFVRRKMQSAMKHGGGTDEVPSFAPLSPVSVAMRSGAVIGGKLADSKVIVAFLRGKTQIVGWVDGLESLGSVFQSAGNRVMTTDERQMMHRRGIADVPTYYSRPARPVCEPLAKAVAPLYPKWFEDAATKFIEKSIAKAGVA